MYVLTWDDLMSTVLFLLYLCLQGLTLPYSSKHSPNSLQISYPKTFRHHPVVLNWYAPRIHTVTWLKVLTDTNTFLDIHTNTNTAQLTLNEFFWSEHSFYEKRSRWRKNEKKQKKINNDENNGPLSSLPVDHLTATPTACAKILSNCYIGLYQSYIIHICTKFCLYLSNI